MINISLIIAAAGSASRMKLNVNKTLLGIDELPVLEINLRQWLNIPEINEIIILYNKRDYEAYLEIIKKYSGQKIRLVEGGETRKNSIANGLSACHKSSTHIAIHDAARPFITDKVKHLLLDSLRNHDIVSTYQKTVDTSYIKNYNGIELIDRDKIIRALTPQCFSMDIAQKMLIRMKSSNSEYTDEISLSLSMGYTPHFVEADRFLFKITTIDDYEVAKLLYRYLRRNDLCE